jgi:hypothetical protein
MILRKACAAGEGVASSDTTRTAGQGGPRPVSRIIGLTAWA